MKACEFKRLKNGVLKVGKNQIYFDDYSASPISLFVVEKFEYNDGKDDLFSVVDGFDSFNKAKEVALNPEKYLREVMKG